MATRAPPPTVAYTPPEPVRPQYSSPLGDDDDEPRLDATPADDDSKWRFSGMTIPDDPAARDAALLKQCESRLQSAWLAERPQHLLAAIRGDCNALASATRCQMPHLPIRRDLEHVGGYYRANRQKLFVCADKQPTSSRLRACSPASSSIFDHCRFGLKILFQRHEGAVGADMRRAAGGAAVLMAEH